MTKKALTMLAVGDLVLERPQGDLFLSLASPMLRTGDIVVGQGEVLFTSKGVSTYVEMFSPSPGCPPGNIGALASSGFNVITLAGNHVWDLGVPGIQDTIDGLRNNNIAYVGAGMNIDEARRPAIIERDGTRFGFLSYSCVGSMGQWATKVKPGCAYVHIISHYEMNTGNPGGQPTIYTFAEPLSLRSMVDDIHKLRLNCDILAVSFHKGILGTPEKLAMYDQQVSYAAIDAGADIILGHHAHVLKGIELYKGKVIFHGLGHFVSVTKGRTESERISRAILEGLTEPYNSRPDPTSNWTIIAKCIVDGGNILRLSYIPCIINAQKQPEILKNDEKGKQLFDFMEKITRFAGLNTQFRWEGNEIVIQ